MDRSDDADDRTTDRPADPLDRSEGPPRERAMGLLDQAGHPAGGHTEQVDRAERLVLPHRGRHLARRGCRVPTGARPVQCGTVRAR